MPKKKEELFTDQMGRNIFVFPPAIGDSHDVYHKNTKAIYTETFKGVYQKTYGKSIVMKKRLMFLDQKNIDK